MIELRSTARTAIPTPTALAITIAASASASAVPSMTRVGGGNGAPMLLPTYGSSHRSTP